MIWALIVAVISGEVAFTAYAMDQLLKLVFG